MSLMNFARSVACGTIITALSGAAYAQNADQAIGTLLQGLGQLLKQAQQASQQKPPAEAPAAPANTEVQTENQSGVLPASSDWSVFFKTIENTCEIDTAMRRLFEGMQKKTIQLDDPWRSMSTGITLRKGKDYHQAILKVKGHYHKLPLQEVVYYFQPGTGMNGYYLVFNAPLAKVKQALSKVRFTSSHATQDPYEPQPTVHIGTDNQGRAGLFCDLST